LRQAYKKLVSLWMSRTYSLRQGLIGLDSFKSVVGATWPAVGVKRPLPLCFRLFRCKGADKVHRGAQNLRRLLHLPCAILTPAPPLPSAVPAHGSFLASGSAHRAPVQTDPRTLCATDAGSAHLTCDRPRILCAIDRRSRLFSAHFICPLTPDRACPVPLVARHATVAPVTGREKLAQKLWNLTPTEGAETGEERVDRDVGVPPLPHARVAGGSDGGNGSLQRPP